MEHGKNWELCTKNILGRVVLFFAVAFFVVNSWADNCYQVNRNSFLLGANDVKKTDCASNFDDINGTCASLVSSACPSTWTTSGGLIYTGLVSSNQVGCTNGTDGCPYRQFYLIAYSCNYDIRCDNQCSADSLNCVNSGNTWADDPSSDCGKSCDICDEQCQCEEEGGSWVNGDCEFADSTACDSYKKECEKYGGKFTGNLVTSDISPTGCLSFCDMCTSKATELYRKTLAHQCCSKGQVPPADITRCINQSNAPSPDMSFSNFECRAGFDCGCEQLSSENSSTYNQICNDDNWSSDSNNDNSSDSNNDDPSGGSSSSNDDSSNSSGPGDSSNSSGPGDDSSNSSGPGGSSNSSGPSGPGGDEGDGEPYDYRDSLHKIIDNTKNTKKAAEGILLCLLEPINCEAFDYPVFQFDTAFNEYLRPLMDSTIRIDSAQLKVLSKLDTNIIKQLKTDSAMLSNDTTTRRIILDGFGGLDSSIKAMNDSTRLWLRHVADSIGVSTDALIAQFNKSFSVVDSFRDSALHYYNQLLQSDSMYRQMFSDYQSSFDDAVTWLPGRTASAVGSALGYGDTASNTLRDDLKGIKGAIEGLGDGIGGNIAGSLDSAIRSGGGADTSGVSYGWLEHGERLGDSIKNGSGFGGLDFAADSVMRDSLASLGYSCDNDSCCVGSECIYFDSDAMIEDSLTRYVNRMGDSINQHNKDYLEDSTTTLFQEVKDSLTAFNPLGIFDSTLLSTLGAKIPNSNTCPDHCSKFEVDIPFSFGTRHFTIDYGLCLGRSVFGNGNILSFLRFIIRLIIAITCISAVMWNASRIRR